MIWCRWARRSLRNGKRAIRATGSLQKAWSFSQCSQRQPAGAAMAQSPGSAGDRALRASRKSAAWRHNNAKAGSPAAPSSACSLPSAAGNVRSGVTTAGCAATALAAVVASAVNPRRQASANRSWTAVSLNRSGRRDGGANLSSPDSGSGGSAAGRAFRTARTAFRSTPSQVDLALVRRTSSRRRRRSSMAAGRRRRWAPTISSRNSRAVDVPGTSRTPASASFSLPS